MAAPAPKTPADPTEAAETMETAEPAVRIHELTDEEARALFDGAVRHFLGISGDEFLRRWHAGEYDDDPDRFPIMWLAMLRHLVE